MRTKFVPGWKMTVAQKNEYFATWGSVVKKYGWNKEEAEAQRQLAHTRVFGCMKSRKDIDHLNDFTKIKGEFMALLYPDRIAPVLKQEKMPESNLRHKVMFDCVKLLGVVLGKGRDANSADSRELAKFASAAGTVPDLDAAQVYVARVMKSKFHTEDVNEINDQRPHPDAYSDLEKLVFTLERCINDLRNTRIPDGLKGEDCGWMIHDLKMAAKVSCTCAKCRPKQFMKLDLPKEVAA